MMSMKEYEGCNCRKYERQRKTKNKNQERMCQAQKAWVNIKQLLLSTRNQALMSAYCRLYLYDHLEESKSTLES